jgi:hypothetical protein
VRASATEVHIVNFEEFFHFSFSRYSDGDILQAYVLIPKTTSEYFSERKATG